LVALARQINLRLAPLTMISLKFLSVFSYYHCDIKDYNSKIFGDILIMRSSLEVGFVIWLSVHVPSDHSLSSVPDGLDVKFVVSQGLPQVIAVIFVSRSDSVTTN
jgi:hypothetical protein